MNRGAGRNRNVMSVELNRDGLNAPWGLRLKGGRDVEGGTPLEITRVSAKGQREVSFINPKIHTLYH